MRHTNETRAIRPARSALFTSILAALPLALATTVAPVFAAAGAAQAATIRIVENCDDSGAGSLRQIIAEQAENGDTVLLSELTCSAITLTSGAIVVGQDDLTLVGPDDATLAIDGGAEQNLHHRLFSHTGSGTLQIDHLVLRNAAPEDATSGGCIDSSGNVHLHEVSMSHCSLTTTDSTDAKGGAVHAAGNVELAHSTVTDSQAVCSGDSGIARGGGIYASGDVSLAWSRIGSNTANSFHSAARGGGMFVGGGLIMTDSQVVANQAMTTFGASSAFGGGMALNGPFIILRSTIAENFAKSDGGIHSTDTSSDDRIIANSTISSNQSINPPAGAYLLGSLDLSNSTVAFNQSAEPAPGGGGGMRVVIGDVVMQSSIIAGNTAEGEPADIRVDSSIFGANNLVGEAGASVVPGDTILGQDPLLGPLADHGGSTPTHRLLAGSPALEAGNNSRGLESDQRGPGFARVVGNSADIGAFESRPAALTINPVAIDFGAVAVGLASLPVVMSITNTGDLDLDITTLESPVAPFAEIGRTCGVPPFVLGPSATCTVSLIFEPTAEGNAKQVLTVSGDLTESITLTGTAVADDIIFTGTFDP